MLPTPPSQLHGVQRPAVLKLSQAEIYRGAGGTMHPYLSANITLGPQVRYSDHLQTRKM